MSHAASTRYLKAGIAAAGATVIATALFATGSAGTGTPPPVVSAPTQLLSTGAEDFSSLFNDVYTDLASPAAALDAATGYTFANLLTSIQNTTTFGEQSFGLAQTAFADGNVTLGVSESLAAYNDWTVGVQNDLLVNGYAALIGDGGNAGFVFEALAPPPDLATAFSEAQSYSAEAQISFTAALTEFGSGNVPGGLLDLAEVNVNAVGAQDLIILGVVEQLFGGGIE
jgi:hypothetical protein